MQIYFFLYISLSCPVKISDITHIWHHRFRKFLVILSGYRTISREMWFMGTCCEISLRWIPQNIFNFMQRAIPDPTSDLWRHMASLGLSKLKKLTHNNGKHPRPQLMFIVVYYKDYHGHEGQLDAKYGVELDMINNKIFQDRWWGIWSVNILLRMYANITYLW